MIYVVYNILGTDSETGHYSSALTDVGGSCW